MDSIQEQQLALILQSSFRARYCNVAVSPVILYDFALTLPKEVSLFWRAPSKALSGTIIFAINRLIAVGLLVTGNASMDRTSTYASFRTSTLVQIPFILGSILVWAVISGIRVHALAGRSWILTLLTVLLAFVPLATNTYLVTTNTFTVYKVGWLVVCHESSPIPRERDEILLLATRTCSLISDLIVLIVTLYNVWPSSLVLSALPKRGLSRVLLQNGISFFTIVAIVNILQIILYLRLKTEDVSLFMAPLSTIIVSRFILELRAAVYRPCNAFNSGMLTTRTESEGQRGFDSQMWQSLEFFDGVDLEDANSGDDAKHPESQGSVTTV